MRSLFFTGTQMIRTDVSADGIPQAVARGVEEYMVSTGGFFDQHRLKQAVHRTV